MRASNTSPGATGTIGPRAPDKTTSPARSGRPSEAIARASQTTALIGLPRQARPVPVETRRPPRLRLMPQSTISISAGRGHGLRPWRADLPVRAPFNFRSLQLCSLAPSPRLTPSREPLQLPVEAQNVHQFRSKFRGRCGTISANGDSEIGRFLAEAMQKVGSRTAGCVGKTMSARWLALELGRPLLILDLAAKQLEKEINATGSGVIVDAQKGYVLTANHVVAQASIVQIKTKDGRKFAAKLVDATHRPMWRSCRSWIQMVSRRSRLATAMHLRSGTSSLRSGIRLASGKPSLRALSARIGPHRSLVKQGYEDFIQTDAAINPSDSGGGFRWETHNLPYSTL